MKEECSWFPKYCVLLALILVNACQDTPAPQGLVGLRPGDPPKLYPELADSLNPVPVIRAPVVLDVPTGEYSHQAVHPSVLWLNQVWRGKQFLMMMTPYPGGNAYYENPSFLVGNDADHWSVLEGAKNPIITSPPLGQNNSDPDLVFNSRTQELFFTNRLATLDSNIITIRSTRDGVHWTEGKTIVAERSHNVISQSFAFGPGKPKMYSVNAGPLGCRSRSTSVEVREAENADSVNSIADYRWSKPSTVYLHQPGFMVWHGEWRWVEPLQVYLAVVAAFPDSTPNSYGCGDNELFLAVSKDGLHFKTFPHPLVSRKNPWQVVASLYRASFVYDEARDVLMLWPSVLTMKSEWKIWHGPDWKFSALMDTLNASLANGGFQSQAYADLRKSDPSFRKILSGLTQVP
ncbi:hypothetical protein KW785_01230 [Candidatus Parcubacteria bacterium]|nr:hypothetical protein [Candidatus Parcubacteria bacterium]